MARLPGLEGIWQQHLSLVDKDPNHNTSENMIANFEETAECKGNWIGASVGDDGKFTVTSLTAAMVSARATRPGSLAAIM